MTDFIVIGGGVGGITAAAALSALGKVTVLERESHLGYHASGRSAALYESNYGKPTTVALSEASRDAHFHADGGVLSPRGLMLLGSTDEAAAFAADAKSMKLKEMSVAEALDMVPILNTDHMDRAAYHADAWDIDTDLLMSNARARIKASGGQVLTGAEVTAITKTPDGWVVTTATQGTVTAPVLVNAAGPWADIIAGLAGITPLGLTPLRRSMARLAAPGGHDVSRWPMMFGPSEAWYAKPDAGALIVSPAEEDPSAPMDVYADDEVLAEGLFRYQEFVTPEVTRPLATWAGLRTFAPDRQLVIGPAADDRSFIWCAGQGGYGFQTAPAASALLADLVAGHWPQIGAALAAQLSPDRFR